MDKPGAFAAMYRDQDQPETGPSWGDVRNAAPGVLANTAYAFSPNGGLSDVVRAGINANPYGLGIAAMGAFLPAAKIGKKALDAGLDMSQAARMARAKEMGFDTDQVWYHGTNFNKDGVRPFEEFIPSKDGNLGPGVYATSDKGVASGYSEFVHDGPDVDLMDGGAVYPFFAKGKIAQEALLDEALRQVGRGPGSARRAVDFLKEQGFTGIKYEDGYVASIFDPSNIRSVNAAFDPAKKNSANLLDSAVPGAVVGGSAYGAFAPANEEQY